MRMTKSSDEIDKIYRSIEIVQHAQDAIAKMIRPGVYEKEIQALIEYVFISSGATAAFPTIVGTGNNSTILHYTSGKSEFLKGDLVVVDCGAKYKYYCSDITRTYPVSGKFTKRQQEIYDIVLATQSLVAENAKPGVWINNPKDPNNSLQHIALNFLKSKKLDVFFIHGIGHHLGLDVHDASEKRPLQVNDIITIEPGIYIPEENIGIRIEDNYWIMPDGSICLSESIVKEREALTELMVAKNL
jgi:Xaa-Pro aminopeptidase